jgi:hypothetical protein
MPGLVASDADTIKVAACESSHSYSEHIKKAAANVQRFLSQIKNTQLRYLMNE